MPTSRGTLVLMAIRPGSSAFVPFALCGVCAVQPCDPVWSGAFSAEALGATGVIRAVTVLDEDGAGPAPPVLIAGGAFTQVDGVEVRNIARWDGRAWTDVGGGLAGHLQDLDTLDDGSGPPILLAAGAFPELGAPAPRVARWDGNKWAAVGTGPVVPPGMCVPPGSGLGGMAVLDADGSGPLAPSIYVGLNRPFDPCFPPDRGFVMRWTGQAWVESNSFDGAIIAMVAGDTDGTGPAPPALYVAGNWTFCGPSMCSGCYVARLTGAAWTTIANVQTPGYPGFPPPPKVFDLAMHDEDGAGPTAARLFAAGDFTFFEGLSSVNRIARWDGVSWSPVGSGIGDGMVLRLGSLVPAGGAPALLVTGTFGHAGGLAAAGIAAWRGAAWSAPEPSIDPVPGVGALEAWDSDGPGPDPATMIAAGDFTDIALDTRGMTRWTGAAGWSPIGRAPDDAVRAAAVFDAGAGPRLFVGGSFSVMGAVPASRIAQWDGKSWASTGGGTDDDVYALAVFGEDLVAGGRFGTAGGVAANRIAAWDGARWSALGQGMNNDVAALAVHDAGGPPQLYAAGRFTVAGASQAARVARWDGGAWSPLGTGLSDAAFALASFGGSLYAGGQFTGAGGTAASRIARWDGSAWSSPGGGVDARVRALAVFDGRLIAAGDFTSAGGAPANRIAAWDGAAWSALGAGFNAPVYALGVLDARIGPSRLVAGGAFTSSDGATTRRIALWNGAAWDEPAGGVSDSVFAVTPWDAVGPSLFVGGRFARAGATSSPRVAVLQLCECRADCNADGSLTVADFGCFQTRFVAGDPYADCNADGRLTVQDFGCFQTAFVAGCP